MIIELYEFFRVVVSNDTITPSDLLLFACEQTNSRDDVLGHFSTKYYDVKHFVFHYIHNFEYKKGLSFFTKQQKYFYFSINLMYNIDVRNNNYYS